MASRITEIGIYYQEIITIEPDKMGGKACMPGLRITVYDVLVHESEKLGSTIVHLANNSLCLISSGNEINSVAKSRV